MLILKTKKRPSPETLFPLVRKINPRRCYLTGETEKHQTPYPPPWLHGAKNFNNPKKFPLEIDHKDENYNHNNPRNLAWISKTAHIEKSMRSWKINIRRKKRKG